MANLESHIDIQAPSASMETAEPPSIARRLLNARTLLSLAFGLGLAVLVLRRMSGDLDSLLGQITSANPALYLAGFVTYYITVPVRALRWRLLLGNVGYRSERGVVLPSTSALGGTILLSLYANCLVPARLGDVYRGYLLKHSVGVSFSRTMGTILAERIIDVLLLVVLMAAAAAVAFHGALPPSVLLGLEGGLVLMAVVLGGLVVWRRFGGAISQRLPERLRHQYARFEQGTLDSLSPGTLPLVFFYSALVWVTEAGRLYFVTLSLGLDQLPLSVVVFVALMGALLSSLPLTPAGLGFVETGIVGVLVLVESLGIVRGVGGDTATAVAILDRSISYWSLIVIGTVMYVLTRRVWRPERAAERGL